MPEDVRHEQAVAAARSEGGGVLGQFVATEHVCGADVDELEVRVVVLSEVVGGKESEDFGGAVGGVGVRVGTCG